MLALFPKVPKIYRTDNRCCHVFDYAQSFDAPLHGISAANIRISLIFPETIESFGYTSSPLIVWVYLHSNFHDGLRKRMQFETVRNSGWRSSKVVNFGTNRKRVCNFVLVISSNLGPALPRFRDVAGFLLTMATPPILHANLAGVPLGLDFRCWGSEERRPYSIIDWTFILHLLLHRFLFIIVIIIISFKGGQHCWAGALLAARLYWQINIVVVANYSRPCWRMPAGRMFCTCFLFLFFIKRVISKTAERRLAPNMAGRRAWLGIGYP